MIPISFTNYARRKFRKLPISVRKRILNKLRWYVSQAEPLQFADSIKNAAGKVYRYRIGNYRVIFDWENGEIAVTEVDLRSKVYKA